jgi:LacI family transcriptional regulator
MSDGSPPPRSAPTIPDVARAAGVSTATAGRALGGYGPVSDDARARVLAAAERLGYRANSLARSMITGTTTTLGVVVADIENPFFARATRGIIDVARAEGFGVILANTDEDVSAEQAAVKVFLEKRVDGLIVAPASSFEQDHLAAIQASGTQLVLLDRGSPEVAADAVVIDNRGAARDAVRRLVAAGHRRIAMVTGASAAASDGDGGVVHPISTVTDRIEGYRAALLEAGIDPDPHYLRIGAVKEADRDQKQVAAEQTRALLGMRPRPTAIVVLDSVLALGVLEGVQHRGLEIPGQVSVVGFDDADWTTVVRPQISVVSQPINEMGALAARRLIERIRGDATPPREHVLPATFIARDSVAKPLGRWRRPARAATAAAQASAGRTGVRRPAGPA